MKADVAVIGAGPIGLSFACALAAHGLSVVLIDKQPLDALREPAFDGREIALTHATQDILKRLGIWAHIDAADMYPLRDARVFNGASNAFSMHIASGREPEREPLGVFVSNHLLRKACFAAATAYPGITLLQATLQEIDTNEHGARLQLADGTRIRATLAVAADSRFSSTRRQMGIASRMRDNGRTMMVGRMWHAVPQERCAWEWFGYGQTLARLPLGDHCSSVVLSLPNREMDELLALDDDAFAAHIAQRFDHCLGEMRKQSEMHTYPLVSVYAERFVAQRFALIGDAAVGMHPVTAHGFNLGVQGQWRLAQSILAAHARRQDIGAPGVLSRYQREHRMATRPFYLASQAIVSLYTDDRLPAQLLRHAGLQIAQRTAPVKAMIAHHLMQRR